MYKDLPRFLKLRDRDFICISPQVRSKFPLRVALPQQTQAKIFFLEMKQPMASQKLAPCSAHTISLMLPGLPLKLAKKCLSLVQPG